MACLQVVISVISVISKNMQSYIGNVYTPIIGSYIYSRVEYIKKSDYTDYKI